MCIYVRSRRWVRLCIRVYPYVGVCARAYVHVCACTCVRARASPYVFSVGYKMLGLSFLLWGMGESPFPEKIAFNPGTPGT